MNFVFDETLAPEIIELDGYISSPMSSTSLELFSEVSCAFSRLTKPFSQYLAQSSLNGELWFPDVASPLRLLGAS